jgi:hypothetical protein
LIKGNQFDTIYHEHFSYLSLTSVNNIFKHNGLRIFDVEELTTHGGSLRVYAQLVNSGNQLCDKRVIEMLNREKLEGIQSIDFYYGFQEKALKIKIDFIDFLEKAKRHRKSVVAYGAAAKGVTFLNFCEINASSIDYIVDLNPNKQNKFMPGSNIPIVGMEYLISNPPDILLVLIWNLASEIQVQLSEVLQNEFKFLRAIPELEYF